ncbi:hypothetical protein E2C01_036992 [Portunus trituberculatus]|uniref:Uncharacterized protein n=1 Tax=Portunus trituberculatus TaxID=210409 RepID=A0A5B7FCR4_PORTR|nr:hypothetical protein [Portunus trituberculatus]
MLDKHKSGHFKSEVTININSAFPVQILYWSCSKSGTSEPLPFTRQIFKSIRKGKNAVTVHNDAPQYFSLTTESTQLFFLYLKAFC